MRLASNHEKKMTNLTKGDGATVTGSQALDRSLVDGIAWTAVLRWMKQIVSWGALLYAARVLSPGDFGLVAMARVPIGLARLAEDFGLDTVLLQDRTLEDERRARIAGFALLLGVGLMMLFLALAQPIARYNKEPDVAVIVLALSLVFVLDALQILPRAMLQRQLQFRRLAIVGFVQGVMTSGVLTVAVYAGLGFWSLVLNTLAGAAAATALLLWWHPYRIAWPHQLWRILEPILQGWRVLVSRIAWYGYNNVDQLLIGRTLGKDLLGAYGYASDFSKQPMEEITAVVSGVVPGVFTSVQNNMPAMRRYFLILTEFLGYLVFPVGAGIALTADRVVELALGPQWQATVEPLRILCIYAAFLSSQTLVAHILLWTGQFRTLMWCSLLTLAMLLPAFWLGLKVGGLIGVAWMWTIVYPLSNIPPLVIGFRTIRIGFGDWLQTMKPALLACGVMTAVVLAVRFEVSPSLSQWSALGCEAAAGALTYVATLWLLFRGRLMMIIDFVRSVRKGPAAVPAIAEAPAS
jgi:PST family polysaccharide transporter